MHLFSAGVHTDAPSSKYRLFNSAIACGSVPDKSLRSFGSAVMLNKQPFGLHGCFPTLAQGLHFQSSGCGSPVPGLHVFETSSGYGVSALQCMTTYRNQQPRPMLRKECARVTCVCARAMIGNGGEGGRWGTGGGQRTCVCSQFCAAYETRRMDRCIDAWLTHPNTRVKDQTAASAISCRLLAEPRLCCFQNGEAARLSGSVQHRRTTSAPRHQSSLSVSAWGMR